MPVRSASRAVLYDAAGRFGTNMRSPATLFLFAALAAPATADTVHLVNGNRFEDVVAVRDGAMVRIRMPHGEIVLPGKVVARVERSQSVWQEYGRRESALLGSAPRAHEWLELARWADGASYEHGMREAALRAAAADPQLVGLAPLMARIGHILDRDAGEWLSEAEYMRRRGYRLWGNQWLRAEEYEARRRAHEEAQKRRREDARQERIARAIEALVVAELSRAAEPESDPEPDEVRRPVVAVYANSYIPFLAPPGGPLPPPTGLQASFEDLARRQPGSLFPIRPQRHLTSSE